MNLSQGSEEELRSLRLAFAVYIFVFGLKLAFYFVTGVMVLLAEALHTLSDVLVSGFLIVGAIMSRRGEDEEHMFGHGRAQNVAALVAATLFISFTSYKLYEDAIPRLFRQGESIYQNLPWALGVIIVSMIIVAIPLRELFLQKVRGAVAKAQLAELVNDELGLVAALVGTLFLVWGKPLADPIAALVVATIIAYKGVRLLLENLSFLLGRSPGREFLKKLEETALSVPGVLGVQDPRAEYVGQDTVRVGMHIKVKPGIPIEEAHSISEAVHHRVKEVMGCRYCLVHVDPWKGEAESPEQN